jgi:hypothetical protein
MPAGTGRFMTQAWEAMLDDTATFLLWCELRDTGAAWDDEFLLGGASGEVRASVSRLRNSEHLLTREPVPPLEPPEKPRRVRGTDRARAAEGAAVSERQPCSRCGAPEPARGFPAHGSKRGRMCPACDLASRQARAASLRKARSPGVPEGMKKCSGCQVIFPEAEFPWLNRALGRRGPRCFHCDRARQREAYVRKAGR